MKILVQGLVQNNLAEIVANSYLNCHVRGMHSIVLYTSPGDSLRLFVATPDHELHLNRRTSLGSLAAHAHHCDVTLQCNTGFFVNLDYALDRYIGEFKPFQYQSHIHTGKGGFISVKGASAYPTDHKLVKAGETLALKARDIHSVSVVRGQGASWFVREDAEDPGYVPLAYSTQDLTQSKWEGLYQRPTAEQVLELLQSVGLYTP
jgi:hypothetical protein